MQQMYLTVAIQQHKTTKIQQEKDILQDILQ